MDDILELETRRNIYNLLQKNPGLHLSKIAKTLNLRVSLVEYHLHYLEKHDIVKSDGETGFSRYILTGEAAPKLKRNFSILRQENLLKIVLLLLKKETAHHKDLLEYLEISPSTLSYHLKRLVKHKIIEIQYQGSSRMYRIKNSEDLVAWLIKYKPYNLLTGFTDIWDDFTL